MPTDAQRVDGHEHTPDAASITGPHAVRCSRCDSNIVYVNGVWVKAHEPPAHNVVGSYLPTDEREGARQVWRWLVGGDD